jgi:hypothetical protein
MYFKKQLIFILVFFYAGLSSADVSICFEEDSSADNKIQFIFSIKSDQAAVVRYRNGKDEINLAKVSYRVTSPAKQIPATVKTKWQEIIDGKTNGYYYLTSTGANVSELIYVIKKGKRIFKFFDSRQNPEMNCGW